MLARRLPGHPAAARAAASRSRSPASTPRRACSRRARSSRSRPFRAPHHSASAAALIGNARLRPGEVSLAHGGVLFMDELPEFTRPALEGLRMPLEERRVHLARAHGAVTLPADCIVVAAMNPCPCGMAGDPDRECTCSPVRRAAYAARISGPLLDRFDLRVEAPRAAAHAAPRRAVGRRSPSRVAAARQVLAAGRPRSTRPRARCSTGPSRGSSCRGAAPTGRAGWRPPSRRSPGSTAPPRSTWPRRSRFRGAAG